jgi:AcrR family transcriptional regulator
MSTSLSDDNRANQILNAALAVFARYGFKRASMEDIAQEAGVSRPALYLVYANKGAIFAALAHAMATRACEAATMAWPQGMALSDGLSAAGIAIHLEGWRLIKGSPHGRELLDDNSAVVSEIVAAVDAHMMALIAVRLYEAGHDSHISSVLVAGLHGIKDKAQSEDELTAGMAVFAKLITRGLSAAD